MVTKTCELPKTSLLLLLLNIARSIPYSYGTRFRVNNNLIYANTLMMACVKTTDIWESSDQTIFRHPNSEVSYLIFVFLCMFFLASFFHQVHNKCEHLNEQIIANDEISYGMYTRCRNDLHKKGTNS